MLVNLWIYLTKQNMLYTNLVGRRKVNNLLNIIKEILFNFYWYSSTPTTFSYVHGIGDPGI